MKQSLRVLKAETTCETTARNSRFVAILTPCEQLAEIRARVEVVRADHPGANHVVHAAVIGESPNSLQFSTSDDGEPKGTSGRPALEVLKGSGLTNTLLMVVRYFGGTKLGTGGLVRAYADAARAVISAAPSEPLVHTRELRLEVGYDLYEGVRRAVCDAGAEITDEHFDERVAVTATVNEEGVEVVVAAVRDASRGSVEVNVQ